jgi:DNA-binding NarL/FixJ family response regulator
LGGQEIYRILLAEDDEDFSAALEAVLAADGRFSVAGRARDGRQAVELAASLDVDAVVMDIEMPEVDGVEATRRLQIERPGLPVIAISGHDYEERVLEIRAAGAVDYVRKSRVDEELVDVLAALLSPEARRLDGSAVHQRGMSHAAGGGLHGTGSSKRRRAR